MNQARGVFYPVLEQIESNYVLQSDEEIEEEFMKQQEESQ